ncbi:MAG TPA: UvrB/UvrC motif-containing protein [Pirellulaceae bacterium]|nr:UvrB/UvrC motif-containing protein [Pirellulaceae bacterium]
MRCQKCEKPATFHITDLLGPEIVVLHLCPDCAKQYLQPETDAPSPTIANAIQGQLKLEQTAEELKKLDARQCPTCGITFLEFRQHGRLGCPNDYTVFRRELDALLLNMHGAVQHTGKHPKRPTRSSVETQQIIRLRRDLKDAIEQEDYETASRLRDLIRSHEQETQRGA